MITKKNVSRLQSAVIKEAASTLTGACKLYAALFNNTADLKAVCKSLEIPAEAAVKVAMLAKDRKRLIAVCSQMLPKMGNEFVKLSLYSKVYKDSKVDKEKGTPARGADWVAENVVYGDSFKAFGFAEPVVFETKNSPKWMIKDTDTYKATYVATRIKTYSVRLVAKCVAEYISHESNEQ